MGFKSYKKKDMTKDTFWSCTLDKSEPRNINFKLNKSDTNYSILYYWIKLLNVRNIFIDFYYNG